MCLERPLPCVPQHVLQDEKRERHSTHEAAPRNEQQEEGSPRVADELNAPGEDGDDVFGECQVHSSAPKTGVDKRPMPAVGGYERIKMESAYRLPQPVP